MRILALLLIASTATADVTRHGLSTNTPSTIIARDQSGNFSFGTGTGSIAGHSSLDCALTGCTMSGALNMGSNLINSVTNPVSAQDAATKNYVDTVAASLNPKQAVYAASTATIAGTYLNGAACVGATFTTTATTAFAVDGVSVPLLERVLIKNQSSSLQNGVYTLTTQAVGGVSGAILTRALDGNTADALNDGSPIPVINGTANTRTSWLQTATVSTCGTDPVTYTEWTYDPTTFLLKSNNLSDVASQTTALSNILGSSKIPLANGGTNSDLSATGGANRLLYQTSVGAAITVGAFSNSDLPNSGVTAGTYTNATVAVNNKGIVTSASSGTAGAYVPVVQVKSTDYTAAATDDELIATASITFTLPNCSGLASKHIWNLTNGITAGAVAVTVAANAAANNSFYQSDGTTTTAYGLTDPGASISVICNQGSMMYVR